MAGRASRFFDAGFNTPKPLILIHGKTMIEWAMQSFNFLSKDTPHKIFFIILEEHVKKYALDTELKKLFGEKSGIICLTSMTRGQAETCLAAKAHIDNNDALCIYNCDTYSVCDMRGTINTYDPDGIIAYFESSNPLYSYARIDESGYVQETAEKRVISNCATNGMYYFKHGSDFVRAAEAMIAQNTLYNNEFYVAPCYNELIRAGKKIKAIPVRWVKNMGTPEELEVFMQDPMFLGKSMDRDNM